MKLSLLQSKYPVDGSKYVRKYHKGLTISRITLEIPVRKDGGSSWICRCVCGEYTVVTEQHLVKNIEKPISCGCWRREHLARVAKEHRNPRHQLTNTPTWYSYRAMHTRCTYPCHRSYPNYGGRGITICESWFSLDNFVSDMGIRPEGTSLERLNVNGNYESGNCVWATNKQQTRNKRTNRMVTAFGETKPLIGWVEDSRCRVSKTTLTSRIVRGWGPEKAINTPAQIHVKQAH